MAKVSGRMKILRAFVLLLSLLATVRAADVPPNIVVILADDLGYGDVHCNNPQRGKIPMPNIERLVGQGDCPDW